MTLNESLNGDKKVWEEGYAFNEFIKIQFKYYYVNLHY